MFFSSILYKYEDFPCRKVQNITDNILREEEGILEEYVSRTEHYKQEGILEWKIIPAHH